MIFHSVKDPFNILPTLIMKAIEIGLLIEFMALTKSLQITCTTFLVLLRTHVSYVCCRSSTRPCALRALHVSCFYLSWCLTCFTSPCTVLALPALNSLKDKCKSTLILLIFERFPAFGYIAR